MAYLCCRVYPLIGDSASVTRVPFHVAWLRDMTRNGTVKVWVHTPCILFSAIAAGMLMFDVWQPSTLFRRLYADCDVTGPPPTPDGPCTRMCTHSEQKEEKSARFIHWRPFMAICSEGFVSDKVICNCDVRGCNVQSEAPHALPTQTHFQQPGSADEDTSYCVPHAEYRGQTDVQVDVEPGSIQQDSSGSVSSRVSVAGP